MGVARRDQFVGDMALVERIRAFPGDRLQACGQLGLLERVARGVGLTVLQEDIGHVGLVGEILGTRVQNIDIAGL